MPGAPDQVAVGGALAHPFTADHALSGDDLVALVGGKGAGLVLMHRAGIPVPPGFTITTDAYREYLAHGWSDRFDRSVAEALDGLEQEAGKQLGSETNPLLVSVRSGARISMPGMMDTVLNVGMNPAVERAVAAASGDAAFAADTHCRALLGFAQLVLGAPEELIGRAGAVAPDPVAVAGMLTDAGYTVPPEPATQVVMAVRAVFDSWLGPRATRYREIEGIDPAIGTAATVQAMVFGNLGDRSGTGVAFSRNPTTGRSGLVGDFLVNAQGEDVVDGSATTEPLSVMADRWPELYDGLRRIAADLEAHFQDMVDLEFTVEDGSLWLLQVRRGKRSPIAAFRAAIDLAEDPAFEVDRREAVERCLRYLDDPPTVADADEGGGDVESSAVTVVASGLGASPGQAIGVLCCDPDRAVTMQEQGLDVILARRATSPADVHGMAAAKGIFTTLGGQVSHAALVAREWGLPAVVGASEATVNHDDAGGSVVGPTVTVREGDVVTVDGDGGRLLLGSVSSGRVVAPEVAVIQRWAAELDNDGAGTATHAATPTPADAASRGPGAPGTTTDAGGEPSTDRVDGPPLANRVLHALRIKGMLTGPGAAAICAAPESTVEAELAAAVDAGTASFMEPRAMWLITPDGRAAHPAVLAEMIDGLDLGAMPYQRFLELNDRFKQLCTDWQLRDGEPNDHTDAAYDETVRNRLAAFDDEAQPIITAIGAVASWMAPYGPRLAAARARLADGDPKALTGVMCDSYHDVWMELHEDLILTQGIDRAAEGST